jgi:acetyl esterase
MEKKYLKNKNEYLKMKKKIFKQKGGNGIILDPTVVAFLNTIQGPPIYTFSPEEAREILNRIQKKSTYTYDVDVKDIILTDEHNKPISIKIVRPKESKEVMSKPLPAIIYLHGGGFVLGNSETHIRLICDIAIKSNAVVFFVDYALSPEARFPTALNQAYDTVFYVWKSANSAHSLNIDTNKIILCGDSAGGGLAVALAILCKKKQIPVAYQILLYPMLSAKMNTESYEIYSQGPWLTKKAMQWFYNSYEPNENRRNDPLISPLEATNETLQTLPPALIITAENDVLRDEGEIFAKRLMKNNIPTIAFRALGTIHDFLMLNPLSNSGAVIGALSLISGTIKSI